MTMTARLDEGLHALGTSVRPVPTPLPLLHPTSAAPALVADGATVSHRELAARLARSAGCTALVPDYRLGTRINVLASFLTLVAACSL